MRTLDLNLLLMLEQLWLTRSVSRTASKLNLAQSSVSAALARLRRQLGDQLFRWDGHEMAPTAFTVALMPELGAALERMRILLYGNELHRVRRHFIIATFESLAAELAPELLKRTAAQGLEFSFDFARPNSDWRNDRSRQAVDIMILPKEVVPRHFTSRCLWVEEFVIIAATENAGLSESTTLDQLLVMPHIGLSMTLLRGMTYDPSNWRMGSMHEPQLKASSYSVIAEIVSNSRAVALVPRRIGERAARSLPLKCVKPPVPVANMEVMLAWDTARDGDPSLRWLIGVIIETLGGAS